MRQTTHPEIQLRGVLFDMDGVLCDTDEYHFQSWKQVFDRYNIPFSRAVNDRLRGLTRRASLEVVLENRLLSEEDLLRILEEKNQCYLELIHSLGPHHLLPGVGDLIIELTDARIPIGVASASQHVELVLDRLGIAPFIQASCRGGQLAQTKPAPDPYLFIASRLGVDPSECLVIEDSQVGVESGTAAGMCVLGLGSAERLCQAFRVAHGLDGVTLKNLRAIHRKWLAENLPRSPRPDPAAEIELPKI